MPKEMSTLHMGLLSYLLSKYRITSEQLSDGFFNVLKMNISKKDDITSFDKDNFQLWNHGDKIYSRFLMKLSTKTNNWKGT